MLNNLFEMKKAKSRSISAENFTGGKGMGAMSENTEGTPSRELGKGWKVSPFVTIGANDTFTLAEVSGIGIINHIWITDSAESTRDLILRFYWDGEEKPAIECPMGDFFAAADKKHLSQVSSLIACVNSGSAYNCYWQMPYRTGFKITLENRQPSDVIVYYQIDYTECDIPASAGYLHAQFRRSNPLKYMDVHTILDGVSGKGQYVGTYMFWGTNSTGWWGEGEIKFYIDGDKEYPTICGTGTEDYFCGSYNFLREDKYGDYTTPYTGFHAINPDGWYYSQQRFSMYRWHITDPIYFDEDLRVTIQGLGWRSEQRFLPLQDDISSVAFWYSDQKEGEASMLPDRNGLELL